MMRLINEIVFLALIMAVGFAIRMFMTRPFEREDEASDGKAREAEATALAKVNTLSPAASVPSFSQSRLGGTERYSGDGLGELGCSTFSDGGGSCGDVSSGTDS